MDFKVFGNAVEHKIEELSINSKRLFEVDVDGDELFAHYIASFPEGSNPIYRERTEHECSCCRSFIKTVGNMVAIKDGVVKTIWDVDIPSQPEYQIVTNAMNEYIKSKPIKDVYFNPYERIGQKVNREKLDDGTIVTHDHFFCVLPAKCIGGASERGTLRDTRNVFKRTMEEITQEAFDILLELINQNSLYRGEEWKSVVEECARYKIQYDKLQSEKEKELFAWEKSVSAGPVVGRLRNHSIGTLLIDISKDVDLDVAVSKYERIVAPENYKRPTEIFTQKMLDDARKAVEELGYTESLSRRYASLDDITVNNILFSNKDSAKRIVGAASIFDELAKNTTSKPKNFDHVEEITIEKFISDVLPTATELELYFENKHSKNMVSLIAPVEKEAPSMFKWDNAFSWAYTGNLTDSTMKENVKAAGGNVNGDLRFSIQWNDDVEYDQSDLDAHCLSADGTHIYFGNKYDRHDGELDVDIIHPQNGRAAVENITWPDRKRMKPGKYEFCVNGFNVHNSKGFKAEIEFDGVIHEFEYPHPVNYKQTIQIADVTLNKDGTFTIDKKMPANVSSKTVWNITTNKFVPVNVMMFSPNYWDEQTGIGNKHYFFMLKDCINPENPNGMYNEYLKEELMAHKRVFAALGSKSRVADTENQLSGLGFSSTQRNEVVLKVKGNVERMLKVKF